ncbi:hypothetical protein [Actinoplanes sp. TFC3]|uniref:hypothetical protein n=1 Tax=Actinoplanes sp. TFC3 TaxID=1710355 RepID=UPI00082E9DE5|nr:hypothetical protein [Actinoplanes sp. TFC3]
MTVIPLRRRRRGPHTPAFGTCAPAGRRQRLTVLLVPIALLAAALGLRATGLIGAGRTDRSLPPVLAVAPVAPGLLRGAQPSDVDLLRLRDDHGVRAVVGIGGLRAPEQAATGELGLRTLQLDVADGSAPSAAGLLGLVRFLRSAMATRPGVVYLHDGDGHGPVLVTAAMLQVVRGEPAPEAVDRLRAAGYPVSGDQVRALSEVDTLTGSYAVLQGESW